MQACVYRHSNETFLCDEVVVDRAVVVKRLGSAPIQTHGWIL